MAHVLGTKGLASSRSDNGYNSIDKGFLASVIWLSKINNMIEGKLGHCKPHTDLLPTFIRKAILYVTIPF
jgi:hypothetical protein